MERVEVPSERLGRARTVRLAVRVEVAADMLDLPVLPFFTSIAYWNMYISIFLESHIQ
jgi:hypothetical protein